MGSVRPGRGTVQTRPNLADLQLSRGGRPGTPHAFRLSQIDPVVNRDMGVHTHTPAGQHPPRTPRNGPCSRRSRRRADRLVGHTFTLPPLRSCLSGHCSVSFFALPLKNSLERPQAILSTCRPGRPRCPRIAFRACVVLTLRPLFTTGRLTLPYPRAYPTLERSAQ